MDRLMSMRVFQRVIDEGGFAAAARALDMSPAVVTRLVADLEDHLGTRLLHRTTRRLSLSDAGEIYLGRVRAILQDIDEAHVMASAHTQELAGVLRVLAPPVLATHVLAPLLVNFRQLYPKIRLDITVESFKEPPIEDYDITLLATDARFDGNVIARKIVSSEAIFVASPAYLQRKGTPQVPADLTQHDYLRMKAPGLHPRVLHLFQSIHPDQRLDLELEPVIWANHPDTLMRAALDGAGITSTTVNLVASSLASGALVRVLSPWITGQVTLYAALPSRKFMPQRTRVFLDYLTELARLHMAQALCT
jgi:DNA-binding transcriptional LysR family regulator